MSRKSDKNVIFQNFRGRRKSKSKIAKDELSELGMNPDLINIKGDLGIKLTDKKLRFNDKNYEAYATYLSSEIDISILQDDQSIAKPRIVFFHNDKLVNGEIVNDLGKLLTEAESSDHLDNQIETLYKVIMISKAMDKKNKEGEDK